MAVLDGMILCVIWPNTICERNVHLGHFAAAHSVFWGGDLQHARTKPSLVHVDRLLIPGDRSRYPAAAT